MSKKMLAILGGPHKEGATGRMLSCAEETARAAGWEVTRINLYEKKLAYCRGCRGCMKDGTCVIRDDLQEILRLWRECDLAVLAAPTYWANVPAVMKNLFDRLLGANMHDTLIPKPRLLAGKRYVLLTACHTPFPFSILAGQSVGTLRAMNEFCKTGGMKRIRQITFAGTRGKTGLPPRIEKRIRRLF